MLSTYVKRAKEAGAFTQEMYRNESNAFWHLIGQLESLSDTCGMKGHELNKYGKHVIKRLQSIIKDVDEARGKK